MKYDTTFNGVIVEEYRVNGCGRELGVVLPLANVVFLEMIITIKAYPVSYVLAIAQSESTGPLFLT